MMLAPHTSSALSATTRRVLLAIGAVLLLVAIQQPWSLNSGLGAASYLVPNRGVDQLPILVATILAWVGVFIAWNTSTLEVSDGASIRRWVGRCAQLPIMACALWYLVAEVLHGSGFGIGAALGLAGAVLACAMQWRWTVVGIGVFSLALAFIP
ncbi:MAG: hypothetical protein FWG25_07280, partial [Promicromonosporaceae bacterium]|nr:hypothetical protein [Promicromonosporaceae bacterium]